ncbi:MAG: D-glycerate dehydrogenase [Chloroflexi bacterium]|nr:MAG: D-glycerate dehydrogenase [Chloroflexota bacterium]
MKPKVYVTRHLPEPAWEKLVDACDVDIWDNDTPPAYDLIREKVEDKVGLLCLLTDRIDAQLMDSGKHLKVISQCAVGYDNIDLKAAVERNIRVGNTPGVLTDATADMAFALLLSAARRIGEGYDYVRAGKWETWGLSLLLGQEVWNATLGLIGFGRIGQAVARRARGFNMRVLYYDTSRNEKAEDEMGVEYRLLSELFEESDYVSMHVNLTPETRGMIGKSALQMMKPTAILINTSRGPVVDSEALYEALKAGEIAYAALDVTDPEPLPPDHKLLSLPNLLVVPHIASATVKTRTQMAMMAVMNLIAGVNDKKLPYPVV